ncbi:peroxiredoxin family protein [bacterium]|nr:peroxiredoxin family protein [bacterium]
MRRSFVQTPVVWFFLLSVFLLTAPAFGKGLEKAPGFSLKDIKNMEGDDVTLSGFKGKAVLINIFTTT